ncbi:MAG: ribosomal maturation YjgA family protein [Planctomycetaceae bacterium]
MIRIRLAAALALVVPLGLATKIYAGPGAGFVRGSLGGVFYEVFWILALLLAAPRLGPGRVGAAVFVATCLLEAAQLWHPPFLERARATRLGDALLGSTFSPSDFAVYAAGSLLGCGLARALGCAGTAAGRRSNPAAAKTL